MTTRVDFSGAEQLLRDAEFLDCRPVWYSSNYVYLATLCTGGQEFSAIYKPHSGESPLWDFPEGHLYRHEAAAYELSKLLGWDFIPPTVVREGPQGVGSVQVYVPHDPESHFFVQRDREELHPQLMRICAFDAVANNADRKGGHCLLDERDHIWGIDHGLCFHPAYKLRSVIWDWAGEPIPPQWLADVETALSLLGSEDEAALPLRELLSVQEAAALQSRMKQLLRAGIFPEPGQARHYPWPLV